MTRFSLRKLDDKLLADGKYVCHKIRRRYIVVWFVNVIITAKEFCTVSTR